MSEKVRILVADDHPVVRQGLVNVINANSNFDVIFECGNGCDVLAKIPDLHPDVCILDISMPKLNGIETIRSYNKEYASLNVKFIILTMYDNEEYFEEAMTLGVSGYLLKDSALIAINKCIQAVVDGDVYICPELSGHLINRKTKQDKFENENPEIKMLTPTELEVLKYIAQNQTSRQIADSMYISLRTVQNHRNNITSKLNLRGYNKLLQFALDNRDQIWN